MARYLSGTDGFLYKYVAAAQPANLDRLATVARCGRGGMEPLFVAMPQSGRGQAVEVPVLELFREIVLRTGSADGFVEILFRENVVPSELGEEVDFATPPRIVEIVTLLNERLPAITDNVRFCARGLFEIDRAEYPALAAYVNRHLPPARPYPFAHARDEAALEDTAALLDGVGDYLPRLALFVLDHAVVNDLPRIAVREVAPELDLGPEGKSFWQSVRANTGPDEIRGASLPQRPDALLARALVEYWAGDLGAAHNTLMANRSDVRVDRWLAPFGVKLARLPSSSRRAATAASPRHTAALEAAFAQREAAGSAVQRALSSATRALALANSMTDATAAVNALTTWPFEAPIDHTLVANALSLILQTRDPGLIARAWSIVSRRARDPQPESHVAYNLACAAAVLANFGPPAEWKPQVLAWLRIAKQCGDHPRDALSDDDFARFHDDPDLRALAAEP